MSRLQQVRQGLEELADEVVPRARGYLAEYLTTVSYQAIAAIESAEYGIGDPAHLLEEFEAQALAVAETLDEMSDQAQRAALVRSLTAAVRLAVAVVAP